MRTPLLAGNWKLNCLIDEARSLAAQIAEGCRSLTGREVMIAPPFTALAAVREAIAGSPVALGAQDVYWEPSGAFTGEVSVPMLVDAGCSHVIVGHSERRQYFGETDYTVAKKVAAAARGGLVPVMCVGETLAQREEGSTLEVIERQVKGGLCELAAEYYERLVVAYEPVWAIGTGKTATPEQAQEVHAHIRRLLAEVAGESTAERIRILYGGSVKPGNIDELMAQPDVDGALVGGASLKAEDFLRIVHYGAPGAS
ncbi:MAG: triose-phosphate isomerase [Candidatus Dadabacteria bacterium]|nr:MAG: triose-phosphate isomerase [Candidatus Dadabacteria bacterium]